MSVEEAFQQIDKVPYEHQLAFIALRYEHSVITFKALVPFTCFLIAWRSLQ